MTETNPWKQKAVDLARELDEQQALQARNEKRLARALIRLTLACEGCRPEADPGLVQLREILRQGILNQQRLEQVDALSEQILRQKEAEGDGAPPSWQQEVIAFLCECAPDARERQHLEALAGKTYPDGAALRDALRDLFAAPPSSPWQCLREWFGGRRRKDDGIASLQRQLRELLAEIEIPPDLAEAGERLTGLLTQEGAVAEALEGTAELLNAINMRLRQEQAAIESFLEQLSGKLQTLESQTLDVSELLLREGGRWNEKLSIHVDHLRLHTLQETDLEALKQAVAERLDILTAQLQAFREAEQRSNQAAERRIAELTRRLRELEQEAEDLRQRLRLAHHQALHDPLTGLPNRQAVDERLAQEFARWRRFGEPFSLLLWDVDHFKRINDRFGHRAGDKALRVVAQVLREEIREVDFVGRYGGEEFLMLLPETGREGALKLAEKVRQAVKQCGFNSRGKPVPITISCGLTQVQEDDTPESLIERADQALYEAKERGRDCCIAR
ncbi:diguanylate cyclase [Methylomarinovum caldicuralii]|uniref:diguanylate cyclase n=1 Tax=Methylomarinovum caldicuralii TaxID=438856 RepID=A0AAU9CM17_9GAMM|nr:GGDEF domain-containing protein [Methylomarinovum caldicuralii]BCX80487.1 diguanylate cyclase [Methylomarinovum caldicuralii]